LQDEGSNVKQIPCCLTIFDWNCLAYGFNR